MISSAAQKNGGPINTHDVIHVAAEERIMQMFFEKVDDTRCNRILREETAWQGEHHIYLLQGSDRDFRERYMAVE